jgi:diguanylate cyclase (GGDEF)-like protein
MLKAAVPLAAVIVLAALLAYLAASDGVSKVVATAVISAALAVAVLLHALVRWLRAMSAVRGHEAAVQSLLVELLQAADMDALSVCLRRHLPSIGQSGRFIVVASHRGRRIRLESVVPPPPDAVQQWLHFPLHASGERVGTLLMHRERRTHSRAQSAVISLAPMIAGTLVRLCVLEQLTERATIDPITSVVNRREGTRRLQAEVSRARRNGGPLAILLLDLDHFKSINDRCGHATGDAFLNAVGRALRSRLRAADICCRWGGEEFLVALPETPLARAEHVARSLGDAVSRTQIESAGTVVRSTASVGVTILRPGEASYQDALNRADTGLYEAKAAGRATIRVVLGNRAGVSRQQAGGGSSLP